MSDPQFLRALVDALVPGGSISESINLPTASAVGTDNLLKEERRDPCVAAIIGLIAEKAGGEEAFTICAREQQAATLLRAQGENPSAFASLLTRVMSHYYEHPDVCAAFHWPGRPPQPAGHRLSAFDEQLLAPVRARGKLWRKA